MKHARIQEAVEENLTFSKIKKETLQMNPRRLSELNKLATVQNDNKFNMKMWCRTAANLFDKGETSQTIVKLELKTQEDSYVFLFKGISIVVEIIPKLKDFKDSDKDYAALRNVNILIKNTASA